MRSLAFSTILRECSSLVQDVLAVEVSLLWTSFDLDSETIDCHPVVEIFNNRSLAMATVNFSVPFDVKEAFDKAFRRQNKSAVLTELMRQAVDERRRRQRRAMAIEKLLTLRKRARSASDKDVRTARRHGRP